MPSLIPPAAADLGNKIAKGTSSAVSNVQGSIAAFVDPALETLGSTAKDFDEFLFGDAGDSKSGFSVDRFRASLTNEEPARTNQFDVLINLPADIVAFLSDLGYNDINRTLAYRCEATEIPSKIVQTFDFRDYGPVFQIANGAVYPDFSMEFIVTTGMPERIIFENWMNYITDSDMVNAESAEFLPTNDVAYFDDYVADGMVIRAYDQDGYIRNEYHLMDAYPKMMQSIPLAWIQNDEYVKLRVDFTFRSMKSIKKSIVPANRGVIGELEDLAHGVLNRGGELKNKVLNPVETILRSGKNVKDAGKRITTSGKSAVFSAKQRIKGIKGLI